MAVGVALAAIDRKIQAPALIVASNALFWVDKYDQFPSWKTLQAHSPIAAIDGMVLGFCPTVEDRKDWRASPGYASRDLLAQLPPTMVTVAGYDALKDENLEMIKVLRDAGVEVTSVVASISWHGFFPRFAEAPEILSQISYTLKSKGIVI